MSWESDIPAYYFVLHPAGAALFVYIMLRSMALTLARGGVVWRGTFYPLEELRKGMV
jgi:2-keto-4-pentenoate hydratase